MDDKKFLHAVEQVNQLKTKPKDDDLLLLYGLYKQATVGDVNISKPGFFDFKGTKKWEAWENQKGLSASSARGRYCRFVKSLFEAQGLEYPSPPDN